MEIQPVVLEEIEFDYTKRPLQIAIFGQFGP